MAGRTTPKKVRPVTEPSAGHIELLEAAAERAYLEAIRLHGISISVARLDFEDQLHEPEHNTALGLPAELPEEAIRILGHTMALHKLEPSKPKRVDVYRQYGVIQDVPVVYHGRRPRYPEV